MYDVVCPVCRSMIEIPAQAVESRAVHRCPKCWTWLRVVDAHPLRLEAERGTPEAVSTGSRERTKSSGKGGAS